MKFLIIDGNSLLNRAYYGIRSLNSRDGTNTNAIFGFMNILMKFVAEEEPTHAAICFDVSRHTFRNDMYDGYKANRKGMPDDLRPQLPLTKELLSHLGYPVIGIEGFEGDDLIGSISALCTEKKIPCTIVTGDRDSLQLVNDFVTVKLPSTRNGKTEVTLYDTAGVAEKYGFEPEKIIDLKSLMGDSSDCIPGVAGIGEKSAMSLLSQFGSLDGIYESLDSEKITASQRKKLTEGRDTAYLSYRLATIIRDAPVSRDTDDYLIGEGDKSAAKSLLLRLDMNTTITKLGLDSVAATQAQPIEAETEAEITECDVKKIKELVTGDICYFTDSGKAYVCAENAVFITEDTKEVLSLRGKKITNNVKSQYAISKDLQNVDFDTMLATYLLFPEEKEYSLRHQLELMNFPASDEISKNAAYFTKLCDKLRKAVSDKGLDEVLYNIEIPLSRVLFEMESAGFSLDRFGLEEFGSLMTKYTNELTQKIYTAAGCEFNINSPKQLGEVLFERLSLPHGKKTKTGYSTSADVLEKLRRLYPIIDDIFAYRKYTKLKTTYVDGLLRQLGIDGKIHTTFLQTETRTGRLSSVEPNLQNIPVRDELGSKMRGFFVAGEGRVLVDADYSQIELRVLADISGDENMHNAFMSGRDIHTETAAKMFHVPYKEVSPLLRRRAKTINFGIVYGMGAFSLSQDLGVSMSEAKGYIKDYFRAYPKVLEYMERVVKEAHESGRVRTLSGRIREITELNAKNKKIQAFGERVARNTPIQGTAADIIKLAMIHVSDRLKKENLDARLILQVHDELIVECDKKIAEQVCKIVAEEMEKAFPLSVALIADAHTGENWLSAKE